MNLFFWKKNKIIDQFANQLADELYTRILPQKAEELISGTETQSNKKAGKKAKKTLKNSIATLNAIVNEVNDFHKEHKLGLYGKARLQMQFMERLKELGYSEHATQEFNKIILVETA